MAPKTLISLNRWLRRKFQGNHPLKSITMNNSFQHSQQEWDKSQAIWGSYSQHNKQSSSPSSSLEGSVPGIHRKGNKAEMQQESKGSTLHDKNSNMHRAGCTEAGGKKQRSGCFKSPGSLRGWDAAGGREIPVALQVAPARTPAFSSPLKISSKANQMSSQALPARYLAKGSSGGGRGQPRYQGQMKKLLCSPEAMSAERDPNTSRYQPFPYIATFDLHSNLQP